MSARPTALSARTRASRLFLLFVLLLCGKTLWGYWTRDLTTGDTSSYFLTALAWQTGQLNILWSPLYTAYFGSWWMLLGDAVGATLLHRIGIIVVSALLVAWITLRSLPRLPALLLVTWWIVLPIHYDTLYEVHLFGSIPLLGLLTAGLVLPERWRYPAWIAISAGTMLLLRNEYVIVLSVFAIGAAWRIWSGREQAVQGSWRALGMRYSGLITIPLLLTALAYQASYLKGPSMAPASEAKHTLNMCQVYAFGHQQRSTSWQGDPWTECQSLMQAHFGNPQPGLRQMLVANPPAVLEHFAWNLSLLPAGLELLLFNTASPGANPDYAPPLATISVLPRLGLLAILLWGCFALIQAVRRSPSDAATIQIRALLPLLIGTALMVLAIVLTQRPRPSYLLGPGVLLVWLICSASTASFPVLRRLDSTRWPLVCGIAILLLAPTYASLPLPSKNGILKQLYVLASPHREALCQRPRPLALGNYTFELASYVCAPSLPGMPWKPQPTVNLAALGANALHSPQALVAELRKRAVSGAIIDEYFVRQQPGLRGCAALLSAFRDDDWSLLALQTMPADGCSFIARLPAR